ncbi:MAG: hypothetical protein GX021_05825 [Tissierellia bacterium]|nr:hypothetical protein [Tissierellia bacterium]
MLDEVYKEYGQYFYVPMTQGYSVAVPVTLGCSWDKCLYCDLNHHNRFKFLGLKELDNRLKILNKYYSKRRKPVETASLLSMVNPQVIIVVTLVIFKDAKLVEKIRNGEFKRLTILESIKEEKILLENLHMKNTIFNATHKTNALILKGKLQEQKDLLLSKINKAIEEYDRRRTRNKEINRWKIWSLG